MTFLLYIISTICSDFFVTTITFHLIIIYFYVIIIFVSPYVAETGFHTRKYNEKQDRNAEVENAL